MSPQPVLPRLQPLREDYRSAGVKNPPPSRPRGQVHPTASSGSLPQPDINANQLCLRSEGNGPKHPVPFWETVRPRRNHPRRPRPGSPHSKKPALSPSPRPCDSTGAFGPKVMARSILFHFGRWSAPRRTHPRRPGSPHSKKLALSPLPRPCDSTLRSVRK
jgi:hypothetical protein